MYKKQLIRSTGTAPAFMGALVVCIGLVILGVLVSCPNPISEELARQVSDTTGPVITITEPTDWSAYSTVVRVSGRVLDADESGGPGTAGERIGECRYRVLGTSVEDRFAVDEEGTFSFTFATRDSSGVPLLEGTVTLEIAAKDWNGNQTVERLTLVRGITGDVPDFSVIPDNKSVTISWGEVPGAASYDLFEYEFGPWSALDITSPYVVDGLSNGAVYRFELRANVQGDIGTDAWSGAIEKMPLSARTFAPRVKETGYESITIEWQTNPHVDRYLVERSISPEGPSDVSRVVTGNMLKDTRVEHDTRYYYRVTPTAFPDITSEHISAVPGRLIESSLSRMPRPTNAGTFRNIALQGNYAYVAVNTFISFSNFIPSIIIFDISNPAYPVKTGSVDFDFHLSGFAWGVTVAGDFAYVACSPNHLISVDISDPDAPVERGNSETTGMARDVEVAGDYAYVAASTHLTIVDITTPAEPEHRSSHLLPEEGLARSLAVAFPYVYVPVDKSDGSGVAIEALGLAVIDISTPANPEIVQQGGEDYFPPLSLQSSNSKIAISGSYAYVTAEIKDGNGSESHYLRVIDISTPAGLIEVDVMSIPEYAVDIVIAEPYLYITGDTTVTVFDISQPASPRLPSHIPLPDTYNQITGAAATEKNIFVTDRQHGIYIVDTTEKVEPKLLEKVPIDGSVRKVTVAGQYVYTINNLSGVFSLLGIDISVSSIPTIVMNHPLEDEFWDISAAGNHIYLLGGGEERVLVIYNIDNPAEPVLTSTFPMTYASELVVAGDYVYVANGHDGLATIDISDPSAPALISHTPIYGYTRRVTVSGTHAYVTSSSGYDDAYLTIVDVSNPAAPEVVNRRLPIEGGSPHGGITTSGSYVYITNDRYIAGGLQIIDVSQPAVPVIVDPIIDTPGHADGIQVVHPYAFVADFAEGLTIFHVADPKNLTMATTTGKSVTVGDAWDVAVSGSYAYVAASNFFTVVKLWGEE